MRMKPYMYVLSGLLLLAAPVTGLLLPEAAVRAQDRAFAETKTVPMENITLDTAAALRYSKKIELSGSGTCIYLMDVAEGTSRSSAEATQAALDFLHTLTPSGAEPDSVTAKAVLETYADGQCLLLWQTQLVWSDGPEILLTLDDDTGRPLRLLVSAESAEALYALWPELSEPDDVLLRRLQIADHVRQALEAAGGVEDWQWSADSDSLRLTVEGEPLVLSLWIEPTIPIVNFNGA